MEYNVANNMTPPLQELSPKPSRAGEGKQKESLLTTTVSIYTKEVFEQASLLNQLIKSINLNHQTLTNLQFASRKLLIKINELFDAIPFPTFRIEFCDNSGNKKNISSPRSPTPRPVVPRHYGSTEAITTNSLNILNLCYKPSQPDRQSNELRVSWSKKELEKLKENSKAFIASLNMYLQVNAPTLLSLQIIEKHKIEILAIKFREKIFNSKLHCSFKDSNEQKFWDKVKGPVEEYFKDSILLVFNNKETDYDFKTKLNGKQLEPLLKERYFLRERKRGTSNERELEEIQGQLDQNEMQLLGTYFLKMEQLIKDLKETNVTKIVGVENQNNVNILKNIFNDKLKGEDPNEEISNEKSVKEKHRNLLCHHLLLAISESLNTHYLQGYLGPCIVNKLKTILKKHKEADLKKNPDDSNVITDYADLQKGHWKRLVKLKDLNMGEMERALLGGYIWIVNKAGTVLLAPPDKLTSADATQKKERIDTYLPETERIISQCIGDPKGTLLTNFREKVYAQIQSQDPESQSKLSVLEQNDVIFKQFGPLMQKMEDGDALSLEEQGMLDYFESLLKESNPEAINKYGLIKIATFLFWLQRILNQNFLNGTLITLRTNLKYTYGDAQGLDSLGDEDALKLTVEVGENAELALMWEKTYKIYSGNALLTQKLRMELPPIETLDPSVNLIDLDDLTDRVSQEIEFKLVGSLSPEEERKINQSITNIRLELQAMTFPSNSFNRIINKD